MLASYGIEMVTVPMHDDGPDVAAVEALVKDDPSRQGHVGRPDLRQPAGLGRASQEVASRARLDADRRTRLPDLLGQRLRLPPPHRGRGQERRHPHASSAASGHPHRPIMFASTSKITYRRCRRRVPRRRPRRTSAWYLGHQQFASIGPDKVNQLRHVQFFGSAEGVRDHMVRHRAILAPKFAAVDAALTSALDGLGVAEWTRPAGGYFVNLDVARRTASRVVAAGQGGRHRAHPGRGVVPARSATRATATSGWRRRSRR